MRRAVTKYGGQGKRSIICDKLRAVAIAKGPDAKLPTRDDLCAELGVSSQTLDGVLRELEAANVIYRRRGSGIFVSPKLHRKYIRVLLNAYLVDQTGVSPFWGILWGKLAQEGQRRSTFHDEDIRFELVASTPENMNPLPPDVMHGLSTETIHGVLSVGMSAPDTEWTISNDIPMVSFAGPGYWQIASDGDGCIVEAVRRLAKRGCRRIGYWHNVDVGVRNDWHLQRGIQWFERALKENGLTYYPELHRLGAVSLFGIGADWAKRAHSDNPERDQDQGYQAAMRTFTGPPADRPDGLLIYNDMMTSGALAALHDLRLRAGEDVQIASPSNIGSPVLYGCERDLLLWQVDPGEIARHMFAFLDRLMAGERPEENIVVIPQRFAE